MSGAGARAAARGGRRDRPVHPRPRAGEWLYSPPPTYYPFASAHGGAQNEAGRKMRRGARGAAQAARMRLCGGLVGPAGVGKTETVAPHTPAPLPPLIILLGDDRGGRRRHPAHPPFSPPPTVPPTRPATVAVLSPHRRGPCRCWGLRGSAGASQQPRSACATPARACSRARSAPRCPSARLPSSPLSTCASSSARIIQI